MSNTQDLEARIKTIEDRNRRVEADKAWEGSWARKFGSVDTNRPTMNFRSN